MFGCFSRSRSLEPLLWVFAQRVNGVPFGGSTDVKDAKTGPHFDVEFPDTTTFAREGSVATSSSTARFLFFDWLIVVADRVENWNEHGVCQQDRFTPVTRWLVVTPHTR